jgi:Uma2 family endonuclease
LKAYAQFGVGEYWIVDPIAQVLEVYRLTADGFHLAATCAMGMTVETPLLPGFSLSVAAIFRP